MSTSYSSRSQTTLPEMPMLADLMAHTLANDALTPRCRQDRTSALRALAKAFGKALTDLPAHPGLLRERMRGFTPAMAGLTPARWTNIKSLARAALKDAGLAHMPGRYTEPLASGWTTLFAGLTDRRMRFGLSRLGRYCSAQGIPPEQITDAVMAVFHSDMQTAGLIKDPRSVHRTACLVWNQASATIPGWLSQQLIVPDYTRSYAVGWENLPVTLRADIDAYLKHLAGQDIFAETDFKPLRPASIATRRQQLIGFVSALVRSGHPVEGIHSLAGVIRPDMVRDGLRFIMAHAREIARKPGPNSGRVHAHATAQALAAVARHWVKSDEPTLAGLQRICRKLNPEQRGLRDGNRARLRQFDEPEAVSRLVSLPPKLLKMVRGIKNPARKEAFQIQLAVIIELLLMAPMRLKNLAGLEIDRNILRSRKGLWRIAIPGHETKNGDALDVLLPAESGRLLDLYIQSHRPLLLHGRSDWLFPGRYEGRAKSGDMLRHQIEEGVANHAGLVVNPHIFRHFAAKHYLEANPGGYAVVRLTLGHKSMDTTVQNYCGTETAHAFAHFDAHILKLRAGTKTPKPRSSDLVQPGNI